MYFVDLPGYGYARAPKEVTRRWSDLIEGYLLRRRTLDLSILILDARRGWMDQDLQLKQWLELHERRYQVIATKTDKLKNQSEQERGLALIRKEHVQPLPFSAQTGRGVREIWQVISKTLQTR
jgi:GTP-binding protein